MSKLIRLLLIILAGGLIGCDRDGASPIDVTGRVTWNGEPVDGGHLRFIPVAPTQGPVTGSHIVKGEYAAAGDGAVPPGNYRVEITWLRELPRPPGADDAATPTEEVIPAKFNSLSELTLEVLPNTDSLTRDFDLVP